MIRSHLIPLIALAGLLLAVFGTATAAGAPPTVLVKTSKGDITIELYPDKAPSRSRTSWPTSTPNSSTAPSSTGS